MAQKSIQSPIPLDKQGKTQTSQIHSQHLGQQNCA